MSHGLFLPFRWLLRLRIDASGSQLASILLFAGSSAMRLKASVAASNTASPGKTGPQVF